MCLDTFSESCTNCQQKVSAVLQIYSMWCVRPYLVAVPCRRLRKQAGDKLVHGPLLDLDLHQILFVLLLTVKSTTKDVACVCEYMLCMVCMCTKFRINEACNRNLYIHVHA